METTERYTEWLEGFKYLIYKQKKMRQTVLAKKTGIHKQHINAILRGRRNAGSDGQEVISRALGMSYDQMRNLGREELGLPPVVRVFAELAAPHQGSDAEATSSVAHTGVNCSTVVNGAGSFVQNGVNGVNNGTVKACGGPPCPKTESPQMGDIARELCEMIAKQLEGKNMDIQIAVRTKVKAALKNFEDGKTPG